MSRPFKTGVFSRLQPGFGLAEHDWVEHEGADAATAWIGTVYGLPSVGTSKNGVNVVGGSILREKFGYTYGFDAQLRIASGQSLS